MQFSVKGDAGGKTATQYEIEEPYSTLGAPCLKISPDKNICDKNIFIHEREVFTLLHTEAHGCNRLNMSVFFSHLLFSTFAKVSKSRVGLLTQRSLAEESF